MNRPGPATGSPSCQAGSAMLKSGFMLDIKILTPAKWTALRDIRLEALRESPQAFLSTHEKEAAWDEDQWLAEFDRGGGSIASLPEGAAALRGAPRPADMPWHECFLEYIWV